MKKMRFNHGFLLTICGVSNFIFFADVSAAESAPICYFQPSQGQAIDLSDWCGKVPSSSPSRPSCIEGMNPENISISKVEYDGKILRGTVVNQTCNTLRNLRVNYQVFDSQNNPIDNGFIAVDPAVLEPGAIASFEAEVTEGATAKATHVDWF